MRKITLLGATGSIGSSTLEVIRQHPELFSLHAAVASASVEKMVEIVREFHPQRVAMAKIEAARVLKRRLQDEKLYAEVLEGEEGIIEIAGDGEAPIVVAAIVGAAGLRPVMASVKTGCIIALANKEALVMTGALFFEQLHKHHAKVLPVDSEHSAIFQCLPYEVQSSLGSCDLKKHGVKKILLTGSGGPFRLKSFEELAHVDVKMAINHPNWSMGPKISVDSATMMNKGLEFIEARYLFNAAFNEIEVLIHPQSVVHSMVSYCDGAVLAQLGSPDMKTPIAVALGFPERIVSGTADFDFVKHGNLSFEAPDFNRYPCLALAMEACKEGQSATIVLNAANEVAVANFLNGRIGYLQIAQVVEHALNTIERSKIACLEEVFNLDAKARQCARNMIAEL